ncbi:Protein CBG00625 [Caenorhabditis briggsae]|uniref:Uncharacterized protein n=2 Tax=Caenorhabditis briggsae TaxID=6238 RepID=A0AAE9J719_CAEBR|nr:Protein CBG00625 [Caenorhabditis briggsae]ULU04504.1 hypothetical protein L3Y34_017343 [Caenorhabditis briggsae]UMM16497.1 hypothetical protein L5515_013486 [Caenorhabditis briggsae]CAP22007.1 Protein CBG00625 [Caenorhabditis briggsae]
MSLSKSSAPSTARSVFRFVFSRNASTSSPTPTPARIQIKVPSAEQGHFQYSRNWSRDPRFVKVAIQKGDTPYQFLVRRLGHAYEVYPLFFLTGAWFALFLSATYWSFGKAEIWLDRSHTTAPWDWERLRDNYWKLPTVAFDMDGRTRKRCEIMEQLQDEMLEAAKKRGTR